METKTFIIGNEETDGHTHILANHHFATTVSVDNQGCNHAHHVVINENTWSVGISGLNQKYHTHEEITERGSETLSKWHNSDLGSAVCDTCDGVWPCHLSAWGRPDRQSNCKRCPDGIVSFVFEKKENGKVS